MVTVKRLHEVPMKTVLEAWERGFEGYYVNMTLPMAAFINRMVNEDLQLDLSNIMLDGDRPVGINLNGIRKYPEGHVAGWNGGIGLAPEYRGKGFGKLLMEESLKAYREAGAHQATLEAFVQNVGAIKLYEKFGYVVQDKLLFLSTSEPVYFETEAGIDTTYTADLDLPIAVSRLPFYNSRTAWQTQWQSAKGGQSLIVYLGGEPVGYAVFKQNYNIQGELVSIMLYRLEVRPEHANALQVHKYLLGQVFDPGKGAVKKTVVSLEGSQKELVDMLTGLGFSKEFELVYMENELAPAPVPAAE